VSQPAYSFPNRAPSRDPHAIEAVLRPLMLATVGAGVMVLGLMQFGADLFAQVDGGGRTLVVRGIRTAFFAFLGTSTALLAAYLCRADRSSRLSALFNAYGVLVFLGGAWLAGGNVGGALSRVPGVVVMMSSPVAIFFLVSIGGACLLAFAAAVRAVQAAVHNRRSLPILASPQAGVAE
jgi:hypothetical protein